MARRIVITSGKGGVGKTSICANLGHKLARLKKRVLLIDVDIGLNNLDIALGVENKVVFDLIDVLQGKCRAKQAIIRDFDNPLLFVMPSVHTLSNINIPFAELNKLICELDESFDYILIDCPAGLDKPFERAISIANEAIVVSTPHISSLKDADKTIEYLISAGIDILGIVVNRVRGDMVLSGEMLDPVEISKTISQNLIGVLPEDDSISYSSIATEQSSSYIAFDLLATNLEEGSTKMYDYTKKYRGFFGKIRQEIKRRA